MIEVLHVEDEPVLRALVAGILENLGGVHLTQFTGREAVKDHAASINGPFILLTDMNLPEPVGGELVTNLRALPNGDNMTAIILTASDHIDNVREMVVDADDVIEKPTDVVGLSSVLDNILDRASAETASS